MTGQKLPFFFFFRLGRQSWTLLCKDFNAQRNSFALYFKSVGFIYEANDLFPFLPSYQRLESNS